ncbi:MAG: DUF1993 domain-containing protein [Steroidobacteraceae bacterium]
MSISMYQVTVPLFQRHLTNLAGILAKAEAHCAARKIDPATMLGARLALDMFPLVRQVQSTCDFAKNCAARLAGVDPLKFEDSESDFAALKARIQRAQDYLASFKAEQIDGSEERAFVVKLGPREVSFKGQQYLLTFAIPNFFFHMTTAYDILRHYGVELAKPDFTGPN